MYSRTLKSKLFTEWSILKEIYKRGFQVQDVMHLIWESNFPLLERDSSCSLIRRMISRWYFEIFIYGCATVINKNCMCYHLLHFCFLIWTGFLRGSLHDQIIQPIPSLMLFPYRILQYALLLVNRISLYM